MDTWPQQLPTTGQPIESIIVCYPNICCKSRLITLAQGFTILGPQVAGFNL